MHQKKNNFFIGKIGEDAACQYLLSLGYKVIERNFRKGYNEIDIVAKDGQTLVFVEVKTRKSNFYGGTEESITPWKLKALIRAANYYQLIHSVSLAVRLDVVLVDLDFDNSVKKIELIKNITS